MKRERRCIRRLFVPSNTHNYSSSSSGGFCFAIAIYWFTTRRNALSSSSLFSATTNAFCRSEHGPGWMLTQCGCFASLLTVECYPSLSTTTPTPADASYNKMSLLLRSFRFSFGYMVILSLLITKNAFNQGLKKPPCLNGSV